MPIQLKHDATIEIATGRSRKETNWRNTELLWSALVNKVVTTHRTTESVAEYHAAPKTRQDEIKDIGGFVGGVLTGGRRLKSNVLNRQLITLDIDFSKGDFWETYTLLFDQYAAVVYSTHKHTATNPRLRLIMPLNRPVAADEYIAISRRIAGDLDIEIFDLTTFQAERLMYWPSTPKDGLYEFHHNDGLTVDADKILASYHDWRDASQWSRSIREDKVIHKAMEKQGDPLTKAGIIGKFNRTFTMHEAIETFLKDVYDPCDVEGRFSYKHGSTAGGLVIYDDKFAYSHHGTDPTSGKLCNAFDLVRIHLFGLRDEDTREGTPINKMPSTMAMADLAAGNEAVRALIGREQLADARADFGFPVEPLAGDEETYGLKIVHTFDNTVLKDLTGDRRMIAALSNSEGSEVVRASVVEDIDWMKKLDVDRKGNYYSTIDNVLIILTNDPYIKGRIAFDEFEQREVAIKDLPWRKVNKLTRGLTDKDDAAIRHYLEKVYEISGLAKITDALAIYMQRNSFHPVRDYLRGVVWDKTERVESLFIDYMGAVDDEYTRAISRKSLTAAVARVFVPGIKFDYMTVLVGAQGKMKSMLFDKLGRGWFSDSLSSIEGGSKTFEQLQGVWLVEMAELAGIKKSDVETIKNFVSKREDRYRVAYGKRTENFPRQCIFFGTTNDRGFLKDPTKNRRFWPLDTHKNDVVKKVSTDLNEHEIAQIWAEAVELFKNGETLYLDAELELVAEQHQKDHLENDERIGSIIKYLDTLLPENWKDMNIWDRRQFIKGDELAAEGTVKRDRICVPEIWHELFDGTIKDMNNFNTKSLHNIMRNLDGWREDVSSTKKRNFGIYGPQLSYVRNKVCATVL